MLASIAYFGEHASFLNAYTIPSIGLMATLLAAISKAIKKTRTNEKNIGHPRNNML